MRVIEGYTFDDVLLVPKVSDIKSRKDIDTSVDLGRGFSLRIPIVSANMKNVTGPTMADVISSLGGLALLHRFDSYEHLLADFESVSAYKTATADRGCVGVSVGINEDDEELTRAFVDHGAKIICVDVAHGHHKRVGKMIDMVRKISADALIIAGNVATAEGARFLAKAGADVIKVGVGPGSLCTTRIETGNGVPQLTALSNVYEAMIQLSVRPKIIADGGIRAAGDIVKSLCFADCVMIGNLLAGTSCSPGDVLTIDGKRYKQYAGSSTHKTGHIEGVVGLVEYKGETKDIVNRLMEGVRSGMSYQGSSTLEELRECPEFVSLSHAGLVESYPHNVWIK